LLPTGQCVGEPVGETAEIDQFEQFVDSVCSLGAARPGAERAEAEHDVLGDGEMRKERAVLEHHADLAVFRLDPGRWRRHNGPADRDGSVARTFEAGDRSEEGGLAAP